MVDKLDVTFRLGMGLRHHMRLALLPLLAASSLYGQMCAPGRLLPAGDVSGSLDDASCFLSDATAYASYRLDLPVRGRIRINLSTASDFLLILRDSSGAKIDSGASIARPIEAGAYTLLVNARIPGQVGPYSVRTSFTAEKDLLCRAFPSLGLSQKVDGALGVSGCAMPDGSPYEAYSLSTFGSGTLTVTVAADWSPAIFIRTPDGSLIASGESSVSAILDRDSQYLVVVSTADRAGPYRISTAFDAAETETCRAVKRLSGPSAETAAIGVESCAATIPGSGDLVYYAYYAISVADQGIADLRAASGEFTPTLHLFDESGNLIAADMGGSDVGGAQIVMQLRPGNYIAQVLTGLPSGGAYSFTYGFEQGAPRPCRSAPIDLSVTTTVALSSSSCRSEIGLGDIYTLTLPASGALDLAVSPISRMQAALAIRDSKDNLIVMNRDVQDLGSAHLSADLPAGSYTVVAAASTGAGFYDLTGAFSERQLPPCPAPQTVDINGGYVQRLGPASCRGANGAPVDYYEFTLPSEGLAAMIVTSSDLDAQLTLADSTGAFLRADDNSYGLNDPLILQHLPAGVYRLAVRPSSGALGGLYQVDVRTSLGPRPTFCAPKATIPIGNSVSGTIHFSGCQYVDDTFADIYKIEVTDPSTLEIRLSSSEFDAYLLLLDAKGNLIDRDDDDGGNTDARIVPSLSPGTYYIVAKPSVDYTAGGAYTLSVQ